VSKKLVGYTDSAKPISSPIFFHVDEMKTIRVAATEKPCRVLVLPMYRDK
jgi:hypothetical protein